MPFFLSCGEQFEQGFRHRGESARAVTNQQGDNGIEGRGDGGGGWTTPGDAFGEMLEGREFWGGAHARDDLHLSGGAIVIKDRHFAPETE